MPALSFAPAVSLLAALQRVSPVPPLRALLRHADGKLHPLRRRPHVARVRRAQDAVLACGGAGPHQYATVTHEAGTGRTPTIVLGGFVPDSTEQVFLLRRFFLRSGDLYCVNYPRHGFSLELLCAQLEDLVGELAGCGQAPVLFSVSFGGGLLLEWLRQNRTAGREPALGGVVLVSPVACVEDLIAPGPAKPRTLLGRALQPWLETTGTVPAAAVEKSRTIFTRLFEAGAQNKTALHRLLTAEELRRLHSGVMDTIRGINPTGAGKRVQALRGMLAPTAYFSPELLPLCPAPALILFAESEEAVLDPRSPTRFALETAPRAYFPAGRVQVVASPFGPPVQHASLIFHVCEFLPPLSDFYQRLKARRLKAAA